MAATAFASCSYAFASAASFRPGTGRRPGTGMSRRAETPAAFPRLGFRFSLFARATMEDESDNSVHSEAPAVEAGAEAEKTGLRLWATAGGAGPWWFR